MNRLLAHLLVFVSALACFVGPAGADAPSVSEVAGAVIERTVEGSSAAAAAAAMEVAVSAAAFAAGAATSRLETGVASWYGDRFHGRKTASGEPFDMNALTAAHPKLPFGSWVRVRNLLNGRSVDVRINDRGPHIKRRIIDLSRGAARALGVGGQGTPQVELILLDSLR